jgi:hypothetical protein
MEKPANISGEQASKVPTHRTTNSLSGSELAYFSADKCHNFIQYLLCKGLAVTQAARHWLLIAETGIQFRVAF